MDISRPLSWLPPRYVPSSDPNSPSAGSFGRQATSRLVRVLSVPEVKEIARDTYMGETRRGELYPHSPEKSSPPRFNAPYLHLEYLRSSSSIFHLYFYLYRTFIFAHILLQSFFDFNVVYIILQISKHPQPQTRSGRSWLLAVVAYIACWFLQLFAVFIIYELVYLFIRRWRVKRPRIAPIYLTSSSFNLAAIQSYDHFCFMQAIRYGGFTYGYIRDGLAETCHFYSQNLPTVTLLLPRAATCVILLLNFSSTPSTAVAASPRDGTFFREDGTLSGYSRGILFVNASWAAWRALILICSWIGLWVLSEQGCAGVCGPRFRWEEVEYERRGSTLSDNSDNTQLPWNWRQCTHERIHDIFELSLATSSKKRKRDSRPAPIAVPPVLTEKSPLNSPISPHPRYNQPSSSPVMLRSPIYNVPFPASPRRDFVQEKPEEQVEEAEGNVDSGEDEKRGELTSASETSLSLSSLGNPLSIRSGQLHRIDIQRSISSNEIPSPRSPASSHATSNSHASIMSNIIPLVAPARSRGETVSSSHAGSTATNRPRERTRLDSAGLQTVVELGLTSPHSLDGHTTADDIDDSPTHSLLHGPASQRASPSLHQRSYSSSPAHSRSHSSSLRERFQSNLRSRAHSLISSGNSRQNSLSRLDSISSSEGSSSEGGHSSDSGHSNDWTFGQPPPWSRSRTAMIDADSEDENHHHT